ncbi:MAG: carboxymuconolactone decarboxylase family protein [Actinomycetia bacterium]|nr:carboxymuconolactone decarboxylase family protein [Actinomycetes bacterium]MCP4961288.1 carboxymuconolactone decarboxylase family protein [Actinomycetes bacterium]
MRLEHPRVPALGPDEWSDDAAKLMVPFGDSGRVLNIFRTMANHPDLARRWMVFANHIMGKSSLGIREREIAILRIGWLCRSGYEWGQHVLIARAADMTDDEIRRVQMGPEADGWAEVESLVLRATDELHADAFIAEETWAALSEHFSTEQMMDLVFTVGQYNLVSMALNSFGVQPDPDLPGWDI